MERIDKIIATYTEYSRKDAKKLILEKRVMVDTNIVKKIDEKYDINTCIIKINNKKINTQKYIYLILNKPKGYITATEDKKEITVLELIPNKYKHREISPVGRLDKDTTGLLLITDDGEFAHELLSPKKHVEKQYEVEIDCEITNEMIDGFKNGVQLKDEKCKPAFLEIIDKNKGKVIITEGKYHQIKRMFGCFGAKVVNLKRIRMGKMLLPENLSEGECIEVAKEDFI